MEQKDTKGTQPLWILQHTPKYSKKVKAKDCQIE